MTAWIIYFREAAQYNKRYIQFYIEEGAKLGVMIRLILAEDLEYGVEDGTWFIRHLGIIAEKPDFAICRAIHPLLSKQLELMGIRVFNNSFVSEICNDKARTCQYLAKTGIKMVTSSFYRNFQVEEVLKQVTGPTVIKAVDGHGGSQVFLFDPAETADGQSEIAENKLPRETGTASARYNNRKINEILTKPGDGKINDIINGLAGSDVVVQPLTGNRHQDLRVYVIGKEIIAAVLRTAKEGFKSNFSLGGEVSLYRLSEEEKDLVNIIIGQFDFGLVGIDFIIGDQGEFIFNEIEDVVGSRMLYQCSDINIVERYLRYILGTLN